jgi:hypothetical protein
MSERLVAQKLLFLKFLITKQTEVADLIWFLQAIRFDHLLCLFFYWRNFDYKSGAEFLRELGENKTALTKEQIANLNDVFYQETFPVKMRRKNITALVFDWRKILAIQRGHIKNTELWQDFYKIAGVRNL